MLIEYPFKSGVPSRLETLESSWFSMILMMMFFLGSAGTATAQVTSTSLGQHRPTFVGPAATGCHQEGCSLLTGPFPVPAVSPSSGSGTEATSAVVAVAPLAASPLAPSTIASSPSLLRDIRVMPYPRRPAISGPDPAPPTVSCEPLGPGCDTISSSSGGAIGVKGLNTVDSANVLASVGSPFRNTEPADQALCAGNGYVVESNNGDEILIFNTALQRQSSVIPLDTVLGLAGRGWSGGGDPSCLYDYDNGGH